MKVARKSVLKSADFFAPPQRPFPAALVPRRNFNDASFVVRDHDGQQLACVTFRESAERKTFENRLKEKPAVGRGGGS
jgi:hypothetical protein